MLMKPIEPHGRMGSGTPHGVPARLRPLEKISLYNHLDVHSGDDQVSDAEIRMAGARNPASRSGTFAPYWHGARLRPAFVAQLLGQVLPGASDVRRSAGYDAALPQVAQLLDRLV